MKILLPTVLPSAVNMFMNIPWHHSSLANYIQPPKSSPNNLQSHCLWISLVLMLHYLLFMILICKSSSCLTSGWWPLTLSLSSLSSLCEKIEGSSFLGVLVGGKGIVLFSAKRPRFCRTGESRDHRAKQGTKKEKRLIRQQPGSFSQTFTTENFLLLLSCKGKRLMFL